ncbi:MAG: cytochrome c peroxidase [Methanosarcinales archaeon]|nr:cytochrome c peroxidase [Methanosarcinales archaeon]
MFSKVIWISVAIILLIAASESAAALTPQEQLGKNLFNDLNLSEPAGQGCVSCHHPDAGFADPDQNLPVSEGVIPGLFGTRNSPSAAYAVFNGQFTLKSGIMGGQFWDGRAANLTEQAKGPFLNPVEMANPNRSTVIGKIEVSTYSGLFKEVCGLEAFDPANVDSSYQCMAEAIAAYEGTDELNKFTSKFDAYKAGMVELTPLEDQGRRLYSGSGKCGHCHPDKSTGKAPIVFSDFKYHNIGTPKNSEFPFTLLPPGFVDLGLGGPDALNDPRQNGRFKTSHLRNIDMTPPYMHNGVLKTLKEVVHFYNTREVLPMCDPALGTLDPGFGTTCWVAPEVAANMDSSFMGNLGLTPAEEDAIVAYMETFTDDWTPTP